MDNKKRIIPSLRFPDFEGTWAISTIGSISHQYSGGTPKTTEHSFFNGEIPFIKSGEIGAIRTEQNISNEGLKNSSAKKIKKGDLLLAIYGATSGEVAISKIDGAINQAVVCIRSSRVIPYHLLCYFQINKGKILSRFLQGGQGNLSGEIIRSLIIRHPCVSEQQKIATFLSAVDKRIDHLARKKELLERYKKGVMQRLFSRMIRFKADDGGEFPEWKTSRIDEIAIKRSSNISENLIADNHGVYKIYGATGLIKHVDFFLEDKEYISIVKDGAGVGRTYLCEEKSSVTGTLDILKPKGNTKLYFLYYCFAQLNFKKFVTGSTIPHIYYKDYSKEVVAVPCPAEQTKIADFLTSIDNKINTVASQIDQMKTWKKGLMQKMFV